MKRILLLLLFLITFKVNAEVFDVSAGNESARIRYNTGGDFESNIYYGYSLSFNDKQDSILSFDLFTPKVINEPFIFSLGLQFYAIYIEEISGFLGGGGALNVNAGYNFLTNIPTSINLSIYYSPDILNLEKVQEYSSYEVNYEIMLTPSGILYFGYNHADLFSEDGIEYKDEPLSSNDRFVNDYNLYNQLHIGIRLKF